MKIEKTVISQLIKIVKLYPKKIALVVNKKKYTYEELYNNSKSIAEKIIYKSKNEKIIGIGLDRSELQIFSIIACILAKKAS